MPNPPSLTLQPQGWGPVCRLRAGIQPQNSLLLTVPDPKGFGSCHWIWVLHQICAPHRLQVHPNPAPICEGFMRAEFAKGTFPVNERISHSICRHQPKAPTDGAECSHTSICPNRSDLLPALQGSCPKAMRCCWSIWSIIHDILEYFYIQFASGSGQECHWGQSGVQNERAGGSQAEDALGTGKY